MEAQVKLGEAFIRRGATVAIVKDQYGDERTIYRQKGMKDLRIKNTRSTKGLELNRIASQLMAERVRELRLERKMTMAELGEKAGLVGTPKNRIYEIEKNTRKDGIRFGTLYALAHALGADVDDIMPSVQTVLALWSKA